MSNNNNNNGANMSHPEESRKLWPFFFIIPILGFSFIPIGAFSPVTGTDSCTAPVGSFFCRKTVTFPAFSTLPKLSANALSCSGQSCTHNTPFGGYETTDFIDENTTWTNFPAAAVTPLLGDTSGTFTQSIDFGKIGGYRLTVDCPTASNSANAPFIAPQWSNDGGVTWRFLNSAQTGATAGVIVDGFGNNGGVGPQCGLGGYNNYLQGCGAGCGAFIPLDANLNYLTANLNNILIRIVGGNGGGVGDNPVFARISIEFSITGIINDNRDVLSNGFVCYGLSVTETVKSALFECDIIGPVVPAAFTITFNWNAYI